MKNSTELETKKVTSVETATEKKEIVPIFVEAEKMFEKLGEITKDIAQKAFEFFRQRGGELGKDVEDWFKAEGEVLRPVPLEMSESDGEIYVTAAVPGFKPEEIEVSVTDDALFISGKTESDKKTNDANTIVREWKSDRFYRQVPLPAPVMPEKVNAKLTDGMLKLTLPKAAKHDATKVAVASA